MDDPDVPDGDLLRALGNIERLNRRLRGYAPSLHGLARLLPEAARAVSVLDVGAGSGDGARRMVDWARARGLTAEVRGIELSDVSVAYARTRCAGYPEIEVERRDLFTLPARPTFDVVHASQVLHHFAGDAARRALTHMLAVSRWGVVINDLHRHPVPWAFVKGLTRVAFDDRLVRYDGPLSVRRGFVGEELEALGRAAGARRIELSWCALFRWSLVLRR